MLRPGFSTHPTDDPNAQTSTRTSPAGSPRLPSTPAISSSRFQTTQHPQSASIASQVRTTVDSLFSTMMRGTKYGSDPSEKAKSIFGREGTLLGTSIVRLVRSRGEASLFVFGGRELARRTLLAAAALVCCFLSSLETIKALVFWPLPSFVRSVAVNNC